MSESFLDDFDRFRSPWKGLCKKGAAEVLGDLDQFEGIKVSDEKVK